MDNKGSEGDINNIIQGFKVQLNDIFKSNQLIQDYSILKGFLTFVVSKLHSLIEGSFLKEVKSAQNSSAELDIHTIPLILDLSWEKIWYPIFKWFQSFRKAILHSFSNKDQPNYVELRKMTSKLKKFSGAVNDFYLETFRLISKNINVEMIIPSDILQSLNIKMESQINILTLDLKSKLAPLVMLMTHRSLLYLGSMHRYRSLCEKFNNRYTVEDFDKSTTFFNTAITLCPSIGETYFQKGLVFMQTNDLGLACYEFIRGSLVKLPSRSALVSIQNMLMRQDTASHKSILQVISSVHQDDLIGSKIVNREIIEYYFLVCLGYNLKKDIWIDKSSQNKEITINGIGLKHIESILYEKMSTRYIKNIELIYKNLVSVIGGFQLLELMENSVKPDNNHKKDMENNRTYLKFALTFISTVIKNIVNNMWKKDFETSEYLAIVRITFSWLKSNENALRYAQNDPIFLQSIAKLLNEIIKSEYVATGNPETRISRNYLFKEDILIYNLTCFKNNTSLYDDSLIFNSTDKINRLLGYAPEVEKLDKIGEAKLRLQSIVIIGKDILASNKCGIRWNNEIEQFDFKDIPVKIKIDEGNVYDDKEYFQTKNLKGLLPMPQKGVKSAKKMNERKPSNNKKKQEKNKNEPISSTVLEERLRDQQNKGNEAIYSGSSAVAPDSFNIKPSVTLTNKLKEHTVKTAFSNNENIVNTEDYNKRYTQVTPSDESSLSMSSIENSLRQLNQQSSVPSANKNVDDSQKFFNGAFDTRAHTASTNNLIGTHKFNMIHPGEPMQPQSNMSMMYPYSLPQSSGSESSNILSSSGSYTTPHTQSAGQAVLLQGQLHPQYYMAPQVQQQSNFGIGMTGMTMSSNMGYSNPLQFSSQNNMGSNNRPVSSATMPSLWNNNFAPNYPNPNMHQQPLSNTKTNASQTMPL